MVENKENKENNPVEMNLNYDLYKDGYKHYKDKIKKIAKNSLKEIPREDLIKILKKMKIIETDWLKGKNKYKLKELNKTNEN